MGSFLQGSRPGTSGNPGLPSAPWHSLATGHCVGKGTVMGKCHPRKSPAKQVRRKTATLACGLQAGTSLLGLRA